MKFFCLLRVRLAAAFGLFILAIALSQAASAQAGPSYPDRPIRIVVGFTPGGSNDLIARILAPELAKTLGVEVFVDNRPGANGMIGTEYVAKAAADGYTLTLGSISPFVLTPQVYSKVPYDMYRDFMGISAVGMTPQVLAVNNATGMRSLADFIAYAQKNPGTVTLGTSGIGGNSHLAIELLKSSAKIDVRDVAYKGTGPAITDTMGGHLTGVMADLPGILELVKNKKLTPLAVTSAERNELLPDVATAKEQGLTDLVADNWFAIMAPKATPGPIIEKLHAAILKATQSPDLRERFLKMGVSPQHSASPTAFNDFFRSEYERWGKIIKSSGIRVD